MNRDSRIFVAGHRGMVGSACVRRLIAEGYRNLLLHTHAELELTDRRAVDAFFETERPEYVVLAAAQVGGIKANMLDKAGFLLTNLEIQNNVISAAWKNGCRKLCFLGSSCIYPREAPQPIREEDLLTGPLEPTNEGYALAKIAGYKLCYYLSKEKGFPTVSLMPCNLYGTNDNYDPEHSHVFPALVRRFVEAAEADAPEVTLWGTGTVLREFLHVDDVARAVLFFLRERNDPEIVNIGAGYDLTIRELAGKIAAAAGFRGEIRFDPAAAPDGMRRKLLDVSRARALGWRPEITLDDGIRRTVAEYRALRRQS